jgi:hypothetical protein
MSNKYGIWKIGNEIEKKSDSAIYNVIPSPLEDKSIELYDNDWVMKITNYDTEIRVIESLKIYENPFACKMPSNYLNRHGFYKNHSWFVLEKYEGNLLNQFLFGKQNLNILILNIIDFIEWLHIEKKKIHGDIKAANIVVKKYDILKPFCLIDYESIQEPDQTIICKDHLPNGYYYYSLGCDINESYLSYRMDLEAFGMILWVLTLSEEKYFSFIWQDSAYFYYNNREKNNYFNDIEKTRQLNNYHKNHLIIKYYDIINKVKWTDKIANPEIYKNIKNLVLSNS